MLVTASQWHFEADKTYQYKVVANAATTRETSSLLKQ